MHFQIRRHRRLTIIGGESTFYTWELQKADGPVCQSAVVFDSVKDARSNIAKAKTSMRGSGRCKVVDPE
jgi:hypothetical protein